MSVRASSAAPLRPPASDRFDSSRRLRAARGRASNSGGLAIFRYQTRCGTVFGHTGNFPGYTQFAAGTPDGGERSVTVSVNGQITAGLENRRRAASLSRLCGAIDSPGGLRRARRSGV